MITRTTMKRLKKARLIEETKVEQEIKSSPPTRVVSSPWWDFLDTFCKTLKLLSFSRKIIMMLVFLAGLAVLLLQYSGSTKKSSTPRQIPNPEFPLPSSPSVLHKFKNAAVSSDSQVCSDIARWGSFSLIYLYASADDLPKQKLSLSRFISESVRMCVEVVWVNDSNLIWKEKNRVRRRNKSFRERQFIDKK